MRQMTAIGIRARTMALEKKAGLDFVDPFAIRGKPDETAEEVRARYLAENGCYCRSNSAAICRDWLLWLFS